MNKITREDRILQIVEACLDLFASNGFAGTTSKQMAKASGVSEALIYKYFPKKTDIYDAVTTYCLQRNIEVLENLEEIDISSENFVFCLYVFMFYLASGYPGTLLHDKARHRLIVRGVCDNKGEFFNQFTDAKLVVWYKVASQCFDVLKTEGHIPFNSNYNLIQFCQYLVSGYTLYQIPENTSLKVEKKGIELVDDLMLFALRGMGLSQNSIEQLYNPTKFQESLKEIAVRN